MNILVTLTLKRPWLRTLTDTRTADTVSMISMGMAIVMAVLVHYLAILSGDRMLFLPFYILAGIGIYLFLIKITHALNGEHREILSRFFPKVYNRFRFMFN